MDFRRFHNDEVALWYQKELCTAFAPQECKPLDDILLLQQEGRYELWGLFEDDNTMLGYATLWTAPDIPLVLLDYLGVTAGRRNGGFGSEILQRLKAQGRPIVAESEEVIPGGDAAENEIRRHRIGFYIRNGFLPAYRMATCGMAWQAMLCDETKLPPDDIMAYHRALYGESRTDVRVPLPEGEQPAMPYWMQDTQHG